MTKNQAWPMLATGIVALLLIWAARHLGYGTFVALVPLLLAPYWLGPVMIWLTNRSRVPEWEVPTDSLASLPSSVCAFFGASDRGLVALGFSLVSVLRQTGLAPGYCTWVALYANRRTQERAVLHAHVRASPTLPAPPKPSLYFVTKWADEREVETANSGHVSPFPRVPGKSSEQFPEVLDPKMLHRIHQLRCAEVGGGRKDFPAEGAEVAALTKAMADFYQLHVETGYLRVLEPDRLYRPSAKGAALMTWRLLPPMTWMARWRRSRRNRAFLSKYHVLEG